MVLRNSPPASGDGSRVSFFVLHCLSSVEVLYVLLTALILLTFFPLIGPVNATEIPDWFLESSQARNEVTAMGNSKLRALLNGLGNLTANLDPNLKKMSETYGDKLTEKTTRVLAEYEFGELTVSTQTEFYRKINFRNETRTFQQKMVRVQFPEADTVSKVYYYVEELRGDINSVCRAQPDTLPEESVIEILLSHFEEASLKVKRLEQAGGKYNRKHFALLSYDPPGVKENKNKSKRRKNDQSE